MGQPIEIPSSVDDLISQVKSLSEVIPRGSGTKPSLWKSHETTTLIDTRQLSGIVEYQPSEYTITVQAGTLLSEVVEALAENGQYLPFDPPMAEEGATVGGTVAAGLSGPGAYRYGPLKDFIIGVRFVDGLGNFVRGGGKVVKNAAGFDFPKLFNGSLGRLGILTEVSFKVFPEPQSYVTLQTRFESHQDALSILPILKGYDLEGVELDNQLNLQLRLGFQEATMDARKKGLESLINKDLSLTFGEPEQDLWKSIKGFKWAQDNRPLFKVATHPHSALTFLNALQLENWNLHLTNGGKTLYLSGPADDESSSLDEILKTQKLTGLQIKGPIDPHPLIGNTSSVHFINRVQKALDPENRFLTFSPSTSEVAS